MGLVKQQQQTDEGHEKGDDFKKCFTCLYVPEILQLVHLKLYISILIYDFFMKNNVF